MTDVNDVQPQLPQGLSLTPILPVPSALPQTEPQAEDQPTTAPGSFADRFSSAANQIGVLPGVGGWAKSLVASAVSALPKRPTTGQPAPQSQTSQPSRAAQVAGGIGNAVQGITSSLGDAAAVGTVPSGGGALTGVFRTLAARNERLTNEDTHRQLMAESNGRMLHEQILTHQIDDAAIRSSIDAGQKTVQALKSAATPAPIIADGLTSDELKQYLITNKLDPTKETAFPTGRKVVGENPDGTPIYRTTYTAMGVPQDVQLDPNKPEDKQILDRLNKYAPPTQGKWGSTGVQNFTGPQFNFVSQAASDNEAATRARNKTLVDSEIADDEQAQKLAVVQIGPEWNNALANANNDPLKALAAMQANPAARAKYPNLYQTVRQSYGPAAFDKLVEDRLKKVDEQTNFLNKLEDDPAQMSGEKAASAVVMLQSRLADPTTPNEIKPRIQRLVTQAQNAQKANEQFEQRKETAKQAITDGDPHAGAQLLVDRTVAPSQLVSSRKPQFAVDAYKIAKQLDPSFDAGTYEAQFKVANSPQQSVFFGSANSLLDKGGTLDQLATNHQKLKNGQFPIFNKYEDLLNFHAGDPALAAFRQTVLGAADDYAKVMGGGTGSDSARNELVQSFSNALNKGQMAAAVQSARDAVTSQRDARLNRNPYLKKMYGDQTSSEVQPQAQPQLPQAAVSQLKPGVHTRFANGQTWTLQNGKPVQVQ